MELIVFFALFMLFIMVVSGFSAEAFFIFAFLVLLALAIR